MDPQYPGAPADAGDPLIGQTVGNYQITQKLGEGGMGSVYLAEHPKIGKRVALKVLHPEFGDNEDVVGRFFNEARAVNDIGHPNIVDIIDYGILPRGPRGNKLVYFIMEFLSGKTLTEINRAEAPLPPERAFAIALQVADALGASHRCGVVHRDLKPDNVMLGPRGREADFVKLLDFGIAKLTGDRPGSRRTRTGIVMGTPWYMSPEQCDGRGFIDHRTDVYALGIVIYEMVAGRLPFLGEGYGEVLVQHLTQPPPSPSQFRALSPYVEAVILKALEKHPDLRYPNMDEVTRALTDPVGYVDSMGGLATFRQKQIIPSTTMPPTARTTPIPLTPVPGPGVLGTPYPGGKPTTLNGGAGQVQGGGAAPAKRSSVGVILGGALLIAAAAAAAFLVMRQARHKEGAHPGSAATSGGVTTSALAGSAGSATAMAGSGGTGAGGTPDSGASGSNAGGGEVAPRPTPRSLFRIESKPPGAKVTLAGVPRGITPAEFEIDRADLDVELTVILDGYKEHRETINLRAGLATEVALEKLTGGTRPRPPRPRPGPKPPKPGDLMEP